MSVLDVKQPIKEKEVVKSKASSSAEFKEKDDRLDFAKRLPLPGEHVGPTQTELANYHFYLEVQKIEGVQVSVSGGETWGEATIVVTVPDLLEKAADEVFSLKLRTYDDYPGGRLNVHVLETAPAIDE